MNDYQQKWLEFLYENKKKKRDLTLVKTLAIFDFDDTLFWSPQPPKGHKGNWWISGESLEGKAVPKVPDESFWNEDVVGYALNLYNNPEYYTVMMTGRIGDRFADRINELLKQKHIRFAEKYYNEFGGDTAEYKIKAIKNLLEKLPNVERLIMWENEAEKAEKYSEEFSDKIKFKIYMVDDKKK